MSLLQRFQTRVKQYQADAGKREAARIDKARTKLERDKVRAEIERERIATNKEIAEAKTALLKAEAARKRADREVRDIGGGSGILQGLTNYRLKAKRKTTKPRTKKRTTTVKAKTKTTKKKTKTKR